MEGTETLSSEVFECSDVSVFKIPPGDLSITDWNKYEKTPVWSGHLKMIEEETFPDSIDTQLSPQYPPLPIDRIRLKLELFNVIGSGPSKKTQQLWALVWYNPIFEIQVPPGGAISNKEETIQRTDSYRLLKIIAQIPGSQYIGSKNNNESIQIALGLRFGDKIDAYTFIERLTSYKKLFNSYVEQYKYELDMLALSQQLSNLSLNGTPADEFDDTNNYDHNDNDNDDFGDFVG